MHSASRLSLLRMIVIGDKHFHSWLTRNREESVRRILWEHAFDVLQIFLINWPGSVNMSAWRGDLIVSER